MTTDRAIRSFFTDVPGKYPSIQAAVIDFRKYARGFCAGQCIFGMRFSRQPRFSRQIFIALWLPSA
jgi:hypothetical protein